MDFEFDKEMDALLRQAAQGEIASENSRFKIQDSRLSHLDTDEISLFAENALPKKLRGNAVAHFADCDRCRKILSDLILLNSANEVVHTDENKEITAPTIPWYRKLFAFPNLAYTLGALVLVFSGLVAFTIVQSVDNSRTTEVSQVSEQPLKGGPFADDTAIVAEQSANTMMSGDSMSNASISNSASTSNANRSPNTVPANANMSVVGKPNVLPTKSPKDELQANNFALPLAKMELQGDSAKQEEKKSIDEVKRTKEADNDTVTADVARAAPVKPKNDQPSASENKMMSEALSANARKKSMANAETTSVGGKTFKRADNVWVDSGYKGRATTNVTRGTKEYKKLDSGLRAIAENLGGTVVVVWKEKAYRIQ